MCGADPVQSNGHSVTTLVFVLLNSPPQDRPAASMGSNKPRGLQAARKLRTTRRENRWVRRSRPVWAICTSN
jgi:hypothetical protein